jgi:hypothetical protein
MHQLSIRRVRDRVLVILEQIDAQQAVMMRRLLGWRNTQPDMVRIEGLVHLGISERRRESLTETV